MRRFSYRKGLTQVFNFAPTRIIVVSFALIILLGSFLLSLPISSKSSNGVGYFDALFTATSATCVTGLSVVDTFNEWSIFGQIVILILIQIGGLGIITMATFFTVLLGRKVGLRGMILAQESINNFNLAGVLRLIKKVVIVTFTIEIIGTILLSIRFVPKMGVKGIYYGLFHSISAFCNAGFDLMSSLNSSSMSIFNGDTYTLIVLSTLVIIGGLGFVVWKDLYEFKTNKILQLHTKVVLILSIILIIVGSITVFLFEYNNTATMENLPLLEKLNSSFFHTVCTRTAGFSSIPISDMKEISKVSTIIQMVIGASPGSTGGGIKITTFGVIILAILSQIRGSDDTIIFRRRVPHFIVTKALTIAGLSTIIIIVLTTIILAIESRPFIDILFVVSSAFATVGLSTVEIASLNIISKSLLVLTMFLGRVGPLTFAIALSMKSNKPDDIVLPEGKIIVG